MCALRMSAEADLKFKIWIFLVLEAKKSMADVS